MQNPARVSIIITSRNEESNIRACLQAIHSQNYPKEYIEIILVDNNSNDRTKEFGSAFTQNIYNCGPERSAQRNFGLNYASGKYVLFLDADMVISENVIAECVQKCESDGCIALYIPERISGKGFWAKVRDFERSFYCATCIDCCRFFLRDKANEAGRFDEGLTGPEDWDFDRRLTKLGRTGIIQSVIYHNEADFGIGAYLRKKKYYMGSFNRYIQKWGKNDPVIKKQIGVYYRFIGVFIEQGKWKKLLSHPLKTAGMLFLRLMLGLTYLLFQVYESDKKGLLILTPFYEPNIGGVETHLNDLVNYLSSTGKYNVFVLTYKPITTRVRAKNFERRNNTRIYRIWWFGFNLFHKLEAYPVLEFLYITPWLFLNTFCFLALNFNKIDVIHTQGFNCAFISRILAPLFGKPFVAGVHAVYGMKRGHFFSKIVKKVLGRAGKILTLSCASKRELVEIGLKEGSIQIYTYWVDQNLFQTQDKAEARAPFRLADKFTVLFVGRMIEKKGADILVSCAREIGDKINFIFAGEGPYAREVIKSASDCKNIIYTGGVPNQQLPIFYNCADIVCVPSKYEEGFGRVIIEALSCGVPVVASDRGGIKEAIDGTVGILCQPNVCDFKHAIMELFLDSRKLTYLKNKCREYALRRFSLNNAKTIEDAYRFN